MNMESRVPMKNIVSNKDRAKGPYEKYSKS